jgi:hypothetical protein
MGKKRTPAEQLRGQLATLSDAIADDLRLPSLGENRLEGYAYLFRIVLPLFDAGGQRVFTDAILDELFEVLMPDSAAARWPRRRPHRPCGAYGTRPTKPRRREIT